MSAQQYQEFEKRMSRISQRHSKLSHGYVTAVNPDGLVVQKPKARRTGATVRGLLIMAATIIVFKAALYANLGPTAYNERVESLAGGNLVEQGGAWLMTLEPVTLWVSDRLVSLVR